MKRHLLAITMVLLLAACGSEEHSDIKEWMKDAAKDIRPSRQSLPDIKPFPAIAYDAGDMLDPFNAAKIEPAKRTDGGGGGGLKPNFDRRKQELEAYPLESLRFVGLIRNNKILYAVIMANARVYRVKVGDYMGQSFGRIGEIQASSGLDEGKLILKELVQDSSGDWVEREAALELQVREGGK